ncbi:MAG: 50S ribosomal protein L25 [Proteobacteria bacterium]|nr:50S ribosomal protein L25 [Pseudomonadota bacterium]MBU1714548.1 50S ribosomal protein L25 [Pseudomonadota bacterium]
MLQIDMTAQVRRKFGKGASRTLRRAGLTPAVIYGHELETQALEVDTKSFTKTLINLRRQHAVVNIDIQDGENKQTRHVMIKDLQVDPLKDTLVHADFWEVSLEKPIKLNIPLIYKGKSIGVDLGGEQIESMHSVVLEGKILDIPDFIEINVSALKIGDSFTCANLAIPENVTLKHKPETVCVAVHILSAKAAGILAGEEAPEVAAA